MNPKDSRIAWYIEQLKEFGRHPKTKIVGLSKEEFLEYIDLLFGPILDKGTPVLIEDSRYIDFACQKLAEIENLEFYLKASNVPLEITEAVNDFSDEMEIERTRLEARNKIGNFIKRQEQIALQSRPETIIRAEREITEEAKRIIEKTLPSPLTSPVLIEELTKNLEEKIFVGILESSSQEKIQPDDYREIIRQALPSLKEIPSLPPETITLLEENLTNELPRFTLDAASSLAKLDVSIPKGVRKEFPDSREALLPNTVAALSHPKELFWKTVTYPFVKTTQVVAKAGLSNEERVREEIKREREQRTPNEKKLASLYRALYETIKFKTEHGGMFLGLSGVTSQELEQLIPFLEIQEGLGSTDPIVRFLRNQKSQLEIFKKQRPLLARITELHYRLDSEIGRSHPMVFKGSEVRFPTIAPISRSEQGILDLGQAVGIYQKLVRFPGVTTIESIPLQKFADFRSFVARKTLQPIFARLGQTAIGQGIKSGIRGLITKLGTKGLTTALGTAGGPIGIAIGIIAGFLIDKAKGLLSSLLRLIKKPEYALGLAIGGAILIIGIPGTIGLILGVPLLALSGAGFAAGAGGILGGLSAGVGAFFVALAAPFAAPIGLLVGGIIGGLAIITFFIVMLTASAFIIPAEPVAEIKEAQSAYIEVDKTANPTKVAAPPVEISYTIQITAKQETIANIKIDNQTTVTNENQSFSITKDKDGNSITSFPCPDLNPGESCTKEYIIEAEGPDFENSAILDMVIVLADVPSKNLTDERSSASASVIIGNPPLYCFVFKDRDIMSRWRDEDKATEIQAISELSRGQKYIEKLCANGTINLIREYRNPGYSGEAHGANEIALFNNNFNSVGNAIFTLAHESGHTYSHRRGNDYGLFLDSGIYLSKIRGGEGPICSYPFEKSEAEDFAEMIGNYVRSSGNTCFSGNRFDVKYPLHYKFAKDVIFEDFQYY